MPRTLDRHPTHQTPDEASVDTLDRPNEAQRTADTVYSSINEAYTANGLEHENGVPTWIDTPLGGEIFNLTMKAESDLTEYEKEFLSYAGDYATVVQGRLSVNQDALLRDSDDAANLSEVIGTKLSEKPDGYVPPAVMKDTAAVAFLEAARQADPSINPEAGQAEQDALAAAKAALDGQKQLNDAEIAVLQEILEDADGKYANASAAVFLAQAAVMNTSPTPPSPAQMPPQRPGTATPQPRRQTPAPAGGSGAGNPPANNGGNGGGNGGGTPPPAPPTPPPATPPAGPPTPPQPPSGNSPNTPPSPNHNTSHNLNLEAAQARYDASLDDLAKSGAKRGGMLFKGGAMDDAEKHLHSRLDQAIHDLMALEKPEYIDDKALTIEERAALVNAYYIEKRAALSAKTAEEMANSGLSKFNKFVVKHKVAIGMGAMVFGGILGGGIGGVIAGKAAASAITKFSKKSEANREAIGQSSLNAGESLREMEGYLADIASNRQLNPQDIIDAASGNLRDQYEKSVVKARRKGILGAAATGAAWGGLVWAGGEILVSGGDYLWNGEGGAMDKLNHLDNPNGNTPWQPSAEKPWWMSGATPWILGVGGAAGLAFTKALKDSKKKSVNS